MNSKSATAESPLKQDDASVSSLKTSEVTLDESETTWDDPFSLYMSAASPLISPGRPIFAMDDSFSSRALFDVDEHSCAKEEATAVISSPTFTLPIKKTPAHERHTSEDVIDWHASHEKQQSSSSFSFLGVVFDIDERVPVAIDIVDTSSLISSNHLSHRRDRSLLETSLAVRSSSLPKFPSRKPSESSDSKTFAAIWDTTNSSSSLKHFHMRKESLGQEKDDGVSPLWSPPKDHSPTMPKHPARKESLGLEDDQLDKDRSPFMPKRPVRKGSWGNLADAASTSLPSLMSASFKSEVTASTTPKQPRCKLSVAAEELAALSSTSPKLPVRKESVADELCELASPPPLV